MVKIPENAGDRPVPAPGAPATDTQAPGVQASGGLPAEFPGWARALANQYYSGTTCVFVLHGNIHDPVRAEGEPAYVSLPDFLARQIFGSWDIVLQYDLARGLKPLVGGDPKKLAEAMQFLTSRLGEAARWPRDPDAVLLALDKILERNLIEDAPEKRKSIAIILDYAQYLFPDGDLESLARSGPGTNLVRVLGWAQNPYLKRQNVAFCLLAEKLAEINDRLVHSPHVGTIAIPFPGREERQAYGEWAFAHGGYREATDFSAAQLADLSNGLTLTNLQVLLAQGKPPGRKVDGERFRELKKELIERQCQGLLEFLEPKFTLDMVVGQEAAKERLKQDAALISKGRLDVAPMGYLLCGPVGTGKTFLAECYAGSIGIPCVKLRNFRSKYVGETEGNLEHVLSVLRSLGPVVVMIDEADAAMGTREASGDSGTSSRVFAMLASQMGDTKYRGKILWMLMTARPELLPIDLKRQGRAEIHIPLFYPQTDDEVRQMFLTLAGKNKVKLPSEAIPKISADRHLSGADIESVLLAAQRRALAADRDQLIAEDLQTALTEFIPSAQGLEKEMQELAAVLECTQLNFLPPEWQKKVQAPNGRALLQERLAALKQLVKD